LEDADGALVEQGEIPAADIPQTSEGTPVWAKFAFAATHTFLPGQAYRLDFEATSASAYGVGGDIAADRCGEASLPD
jgi:hypothetical protein